ncbi:MAG TPA: hypothetical protein VFH95_05200 [Candidatus Kapabacteria bacterium]|nr:hypothetical protein [Candidatus Kapabacteria bacterium]
MSTLSKKFSTIAAALVIAAISIYATSLTFTSTNQTAHQMTVTLNMQSGAQVPVTLAPGQSVPSQLNGNNVIGLWLYGAYAPAGANAVIPSPYGGSVTLMWQMSGGTAVGCSAQPDCPTGTTIS